MEEKSQSVVMQNRKRIEINACDEVVSFNENEVVLNVCGSTMSVKGALLRVREISGEMGEVVIEGEEIDSVTYSRGTRRKKEGIVGRILK